jgi:hypothetical protein
VQEKGGQKKIIACPLKATPVCGDVEGIEKGREEVEDER